MFISVLNAEELANMLRNSRNHSQRCRLSEHLNQFQSSLQKLVCFYLIIFLVFNLLVSSILKKKSYSGNQIRNNSSSFSDFIFYDSLKPVKPNEIIVKEKAAIPEPRDLQRNENISRTLNEKESECPICIETFIEVNKLFLISYSLK